MIDSNLNKIGIFRGVPFRYLSVSEGTTKNPQIIRYAGSKFSDVVENSEGPRPVRIQAVFTGPAADVEKALFLRVARLPGSGILIHPDVGVATAMCTVHDADRDATVEGYVGVSLEFLILAPAAESEIAYAAAMSTKAVAVQVAAFARVATMHAPYSSAYQSAVEVDTTTAATTLSAALSGAMTGLQGARLRALLGRASTVSDIGDYWQSAAALVDNIDAAQAAIDAIVAIWSSIVDQLRLGDNQLVELDNTAAQYEAIAAFFAARLATLIIEAEYSSFDDAQAAATAAYNSINLVAQLAESSQMVGAISSMLGLMYQGVVVEALQLPRRVQFAIEGPTSTLELSYRLYGTIDRADEIQANNAIADPSCIELSTVWVLTE